MKRSPCADCENKGCGAYHDKCEAYQEYAAERHFVSKKKEENIDESYGFFVQKRNFYKKYYKKWKFYL